MSQEPTDNMTEAKNVAKESTGKVKYLKFECPFDLDTIFSLQYDTRGLKGVLEFILENMGGLRE
jgi:hypothetical protein